MKTPITSIKRLALALCLATPVVSWAVPTATAVWRSNLGQSYTIGGHTYAVSPNGGTLSDGVITMGSAEQVLGATIDLPSGTRNVSVLVKFSGLSLREEPYGGTALAAIVNANNQEVGAGEHKSADHLHAYYIDSSSGYVDYDTTPGTLSSGYMLFSYAPNSGTRFYLGETIGSLAGGTCGSAHYSNVDTSKVAIGGPATMKLYDTSSGFVIEEVAIFVGSYLTASDVAEYAFPTLNLDETAVMTMTELNTAVAAFGENTFNYYSASPVVTLDVEPSDATKTYIQSTLWNGTVFIKDVDKTDIYLTNYGNKNSTLKFSGVNGYIASAQFTNNATPVIELEDSITEGREYGLHLSNGYSFKDGYNNYKFTNTPELKGSGTLKTSGGGDGVLVVVDKWDNFTGKLDLSGKTIWFGTGVPELNNDSWVNLVNKPGTVRLGSTIPSNYSTWTVPNGYHGTVVQTTAANATETAFLTASAWKGTCKIAWNPGNSALDIVNYGNANSVIEIATNFGVYPTQNGGKDGAEVAGEVKIAENVTWTVSNGWTAESYRTTFAKLSGAGNLTVNGGSGGVGDPIPYTITRLEGFTGTIAGTRGKFTIGTIVAAAEPTPGTKLVNITTSNEPVLDNTEVYYNNAKVEDIELEFKTGDGIYVKYPPVARITSADGETVTPYTDAATAFAAVQEGETLTLLADLELTETITVTNSFTLGGAVTVSSGSNSIGLQMSGATLTVVDDITISAFLMGGDANAQFVFPTTKYNQNAYKVKAGPDFFMDASVNYNVVAEADEVSGTTTYKWVLRSTFIFDITKNHSSVTYEGGSAVARRVDVSANEVIEFFVMPDANYAVTSVVAETEDGTTALTPVEGNKYSVTVTKNVAVTVNTAATIPEATVNGKTFVLTQVGDSNVRTGSVTLEQPFASVADALALIVIKTAAGNTVTGGYNIDAVLSDGNVTATYTVTLKGVDFSGAEKLWTDAEEGKVVLNAAVVEGLYYGVTTDDSISSALTTKPTLTVATAENKTTILKADKQTGDAGFYKVWISDEE